MADPISPSGVMKLSMIAYLKRVIGQALTEGASDDAVDRYLAEMGVEQFEKYRLQVMQKDKFPLLYGAEIQKIGGRNKFRELFGLPPVEIKQTQAFDYPLTELGDAEFFATKYKDTLRYDRIRERWLLADVDTGLWITQQDEQVMALAGASIRDRQAKALEYDDHAQRKEMADWALKGESRSRLANTVTLARGLAPLSDDGLQWDRDPFLLGCQTGVVDLRTGVHRKADPDERITMRTRVHYDPQATCPLWIETVKSTFAGHSTSSDLLDSPDAESQRIVEFIQRAFGYSITADCREECCFFAWGEGGNGKGTLMNTIGWLMGDYTDDMPYATLERNARQGGGIPNDVAKMQGKRLITCGEVNEFTVNESRLKALTGRDPMTARFLHKDFFTFTPVGKIWIATNNKPRITGTDDGIWRRIHFVPFTNKFDGESKNDKLKDQLREELPGILNWLIEGTRMWLDKGLDPPATVKAATSAYREESNPITPFVDARCVIDEKLHVRAMSAWTDYKNFSAADQGPFTLGEKQFHQAMARRFKRQENRQKQIFYVGVGLLDSRQEGGPRDPGF